MIAALALVLVIWSGDPPDCPRLGPEIVVWGSSPDDAIAKAVAKAEKRGATHLYVIKTEPRGGYQYLRAGALKCEEGK